MKPLGFENTFAMIIRGEDAKKWQIKSLSEACKYSPQMKAGFGYEFLERADGYPGLSKTYNLKFANIKQMELGLMYQALKEKQVDFIAANSTDGLIPVLNLVILEDDKKLLDYEIKNSATLYVMNLTNITSIEMNQNSQIELIDTFINIINSFNHQFVNELTTLESMGFSDRNRNISLLTLYQGNIELVISILLEEIPLSEALSCAIIFCLISALSSVKTNLFVISKNSITIFVTPKPTLFSFNSGYISYNSSVNPILSNWIGTLIVSL
jgi:ABC-type transport system substrate-binding protein